MLAPEIKFKEIFKLVLVKTVAPLTSTMSRHAYVFSDLAVLRYGVGIKLLSEAGCIPVLEIIF